MYESTVTKDSRVLAGVRFQVRRISYGGRLELLRQVREIATKQEFQSASTHVTDRLDAQIAGRELRLAVLRWGLVTVHGLTIDGQTATTEDAILRGPEALADEIAEAIEAQMSLSEEERKN